MMRMTLIAACVALAAGLTAGPTSAKLPALSEEQKLKAEEAKAKAAEAAKKGAEALAKAQDRVAERYSRDQRAKGIEMKPSAMPAPPSPAGTMPPQKK